MKRRQFLWSMAASGTSLLAAAGSAAAGGVSIDSMAMPASFGSATSSVQSLLLRLDAPVANQDQSACAWRAHAASCVATAPRWRMTVYGLVRGASSSLQTLRIDARYSDGAGGTHHHALYGFNDGAFDSYSKPVGFSFAAGALQALEIEQGHRGSERFSSNCHLDGRLMPGIYALITSPAAGRFDLANLDYSGQENEPLRRRDRKPLALDYLALEIAEDA